MNEGKAARPRWWSRPLGDGAKQSPTPEAPAQASAGPAPDTRMEQPGAAGASSGQPEASCGPVPAAEAAAGGAASADTAQAAGRQRPHGVGSATGGVPLAKGDRTAEAAAPGTSCPAPQDAATAGPAPSVDGARAPEDAAGPAPVDQPQPHGSAPEVAPSEPVEGNPYATPAHGTVVGPVAAAQAAPQHPVDPYGTPPYGRPGPWAPAPPVQHPAGQAPPVAGAAPHPAASAPHAPVGGAALPGTAPAAPLPPAQPPAAPAPSGAVPYDHWALPAPAPGPGPASRRGRLVVGALLVALLAGAVGGVTGAYLERRDGGGSVSLPQAPVDRSGRAPGTVAGIAAATLPGVVYIHVKGDGEEGTGTGFVLDSAGHILTNNHVVAPAASSGDISVTFNGGAVHKATIVGRDSGDDLAVIKADGAFGLKPLVLGNSDSVRVGDPVVAIGAPYDLEGTVTSGIISAKDRPITASEGAGGGGDVSYVNALQTDAPINPGNSGGPLMNVQGQVIGINSAIRSAGSGSPDGSGSQGGSIGLGFAIPVNQAKRVAEELISTGKASHPVIGVTVDMRYAGDGARIADSGTGGAPAVTPGGPGATAGLKPGDVITQVDGEPVHTGPELIVKTRSHRPGDRIRLTVKSGGAAPRDVQLVLGGSTTG